MRYPSDRDLGHDYWPLGKQRRLRHLPATVMAYNARYGLVVVPVGIWATLLVMPATKMMRQRGRWRLEKETKR